MSETVTWTPPYPAPDGWTWMEQNGSHYLAHELAEIGERAVIGERAKGLVTGMTLGYRWSIYRDRDGASWLVYGCELLTWDDWLASARGQCEGRFPSRQEGR